MIVGPQSSNAPALAVGSQIDRHFRFGDDVLLNAGRLILSSNLAPASLKWQVYQAQKDGKRKLIISQLNAGADVVLPVGVYKVSAGQGKGKEMLIKEVGIVAGKLHRQHFDMKK